MNNYLYLIKEMHNLSNKELIWDYVNHIDEKITPKELSRVINYFIKNLRTDNQVSGLDHHKLCGIRDWCDLHDDFTSRQLKYSLLTMAIYWNEINEGYNSPYQYHGYYDGTHYDRGLDPFYDMDE